MTGLFGWFSWFLGGLTGLWLVSSFTANENSDKHYQTVWAKDVTEMSQKEKKAVDTCLRSLRKNIFVEKSVAFSHFVGNKE